jgi:hypothetical protein
MARCVAPCRERWEMLVNGVRLVVMGALAVSVTAFAELQEVRVGGQIIVLGEYYTNVQPADDGLRVPWFHLLGRPTGSAPGEGIFSGFAFDDDGNGLAVVSQWTRLSVDADFSDRVHTTVEFDHIAEWGSAFRSEFVTGADGTVPGEVNLLQAFIEVDALFGWPLRARLGRQEIRLGSEWLVGGNDGGPAPAWGLSFDGIRLTYAADDLSVDAWATKMFDDGGIESDGDVDFYGIYGSYTGIEALSLDAYWMYVRDAGGIEDTDLGPALDWIEDLAGVDEYTGTRLHTVGLRASGARGPIDFEAELAYQFGAAAHAGSLFRPVQYGDGEADYDHFGLNLEAGYGLSLPWEPRLYLAFAWLEGEDNRGIGWLDWIESLVNPFYTRDASTSFNRLFSNWSYSGVLDGTDLSNVQVFRAGLNLLPEEKLELGLDLGYYRTDKAFAHPAVPLLSFWTRDADRDLGWELNISATWQYSEDLYINVGWNHLFVGDGLREGHFNAANGLEFNGGSDSDDVDYFYFETGIFF